MSGSMSHAPQDREAIARNVVERHFSLHPELDARYGPAGRRKCFEDTLYHLSYLEEAVQHGRPALFVDYIEWARTMLAGRNVPAADLAANLRILRDAVAEGPAATSAAQTIDAALEKLEAAAPAEPVPDASLSPAAARYLELLLGGDRAGASRLVLDLAEGGAPIREIYLGLFEPVQREIGRLWQLNRISVAHEHYCTAATQMIMSQLHPRIFSTPRVGRKLVATCVGGELHEIGVRMVADLFELEGWDTYYLGSNVPVDGVVRAALEQEPDVIAISATMTFHLPRVREAVQALRSRAELSRSRILVGGYPFLKAPGLWRSLGADGSTSSAGDAVAAAADLLRGSP